MPETVRNIGAEPWRRGGRMANRENQAVKRSPTRRSNAERFSQVGVLVPGAGFSPSQLGRSVMLTRALSQAIVCCLLMASTFTPANALTQQELVAKLEA